MPNKRLRELYAGMAELRLLEEQVASLQTRKKSSEQLHLHRGEEGVFASTILSLNRDDLTSEYLSGVAIDFLRGAKLPALLRTTAASIKRSPSELPPFADTTVRLHVAIGAALALTASRQKGSLLVAYVRAGDLTAQQWKPVLKLAAAQVAPALFVVLPDKTAKPGQLSYTATSCGVPGIPVDAADPVALYRVTQESMLRIRAGGGPVLMECIPFQLPGKQQPPADPILTMQQFMLPRGVANEAWFNQVATRFATRLKTARE